MSKEQTLTVLRNAVQAVLEASRRVSELEQFEIEDSTGDGIEIPRIVGQLDEIHSELDDALFGLDDDDLDDDFDDFDDDDLDEDDWEEAE